MMTPIDLDQWERKEHFDFFSRSDLPFYNVNFNVDVTGLREACQAHNVSLTAALIHTTVKALSGIDAFLYRIENRQVVRYDTLDPSFTAIRPGEELFRLITVPFHQELSTFHTIIKNAVADSTEYFDTTPFRERSNFVFISPLPWIPFTGVDHTQTLNKDDAIPRISWGKIHPQHHETVLPYNIQVNHRLVDGLHVGRFYDCLNEEIQRLIRL